MIALVAKHAGMSFGICSVRSLETAHQFVGQEMYVNCEQADTVSTSQNIGQEPRISSTNHTTGKKGI